MEKITREFQRPNYLDEDCKEDYIIVQGVRNEYKYDTEVTCPKIVSELIDECNRRHNEANKKVVLENQG